MRSPLGIEPDICFDRAEKTCREWGIDAFEELQEYEAEHGRMARHAARFATLLLTMDRQPALRWCAIKALSWQPRIFARLLASELGGGERARAEVGGTPGEWRSSIHETI